MRGSIVANGVRLARVMWEFHSLPAVDAGQAHVFFELGDHLGSTSVVLDQATGELVERATFQAYGGAESDYRPARWAGFREDYRFTGKEEDVEVGLQYFGKRFLNPLLGRWVSADPLAVHVPGEADWNLYAYVSGSVLKAIDPIGLQESNPDKAKAVQAAGSQGLNLTFAGAAPEVGPAPGGSDSDAIESMLNAWSGAVDLHSPWVNENRIYLPRMTISFDSDVVGRAAESGLTPEGQEHDDRGIGRLQLSDGTGAAKGAFNSLPIVPDLEIAPDEQSGALVGEGVSMGMGAVGAGRLVLSAPKLALSFSSAGRATHVGGAGKAGGNSVFNPTPSMRNCVNSVCAFVNSVKTRTLHTASQDVAWNGGLRTKAIEQIMAQTGVRVSPAYQTNKLMTTHSRQFYLVFKGTGATSDHVAVGIVNNGRRMIYDPQVGVTYFDVRDFGTFTAFPIAF